MLWANLIVSLVPASTREPEYFISVIEDITRRKRAESFLRILSTREVDVLGEMARGLTNTEIAENLSFSTNTVKADIRSITEKLGASDRTQAAVHAAETGLFDPEFKVPDAATPIV